MNIIVFSKNRSYQLDAFLNSAKQNAKISGEKITVIHKYDEKYNSSLLTLKEEHKDVKFVDEVLFSKQIMELIDSSDDIVSFATDDAVFTRKLNENLIATSLNVTNVLCYSSRLGLNLDFCYPLNKLQKVPNCQLINEILFFDWKTSEMDWGYPMSVDGHFFKKETLKQLLQKISFNNPNSLESNLSQLSRFIENNQYMASGIFSHYFNIPINVVQSEFLNRHGTITIDELEEAYKSGKRFDVSQVYHYMNVSAHQELKII